MKRKLLALLLALTLLLTCAVTVSADTVTILYKGDTVEADQPFQVDLGENPFSINNVEIHSNKNGEYTTKFWNQSEQTGEDWQIADNYLTVGGKYVSASDDDSMVGMMLTGIEYSLYIPCNNGGNEFTLTFRLNSEGVYVYSGCFDILNVTGATVDLEKKRFMLKSRVN